MVKLFQSFKNVYGFQGKIKPTNIPFCSSESELTKWMSSIKLQAKKKKHQFYNSTPNSFRTDCSVASVFNYIWINIPAKRLPKRDDGFHCNKSKSFASGSILSIKVTNKYAFAVHCHGYSLDCRISTLQPIPPKWNINFHLSKMNQLYCVSRVFVCIRSSSLL